jgi:hypothetical protein
MDTRHIGAKSADGSGVSEELTVKAVASRQDRAQAVFDALTSHKHRCRGTCRAWTPHVLAKAFPPKVYGQDTYTVHKCTGCGVLATKNVKFCGRFEDKAYHHDDTILDTVPWQIDQVSDVGRYDKT